MLDLVRICRVHLQRLRTRHDLLYQLGVFLALDESHCLKIVNRIVRTDRVVVLRIQFLLQLEQELVRIGQLRNRLLPVDEALRAFFVNVLCMQRFHQLGY